MKSIKEKAEEYQETALKEKGAILRIDVKTAFRAGANYVIEEIEEFQKLFSSCMNAHANGYLKSVIEQLKK